MKADRAICCQVMLLLAMGSTAQAAVYHCVRDGRQVYTDTPCTPEAQPAQLPSINRADPVTDPGGLAKQFDRQQEQAHQARDRADDVWLKAYEVKKARDARIRKGLVEGHVVEGMSPHDVERVLGVPTSTLGTSARPRRWEYRNGKSRSSVTFRNGRVIGVRKTGPDPP